MARPDERLISDFEGVPSTFNIYKPFCLLFLSGQHCLQSYWRTILWAPLRGGWGRSNITYLYFLNVTINWSNHIHIFNPNKFVQENSNMQYANKTVNYIFICISKIWYLCGGQRTPVCVGQSSIEPVVCDVTKERGSSENNLSNKPKWDLSFLRTGRKFEKSFHVESKVALGRK